MTYVYENPIDNGYKRIKIPTKIHNKAFIYDRIRITERVEYYINDTSLMIDTYINWIGILMITVSFPFIIFWNGLGNIYELWDEYIRIINPKKYGSFTSHVIWKQDYNKYEGLAAVIPTEFK